MINNRSKPKLGERLYKIRNDKKLSLQQVADLTGISRSTLYKVERKGVSLTYDKLVELSYGLEIDISELFSDHGDNKEKRPITARRVVTPLDAGEIIETDNYIYHYLCNELAQKTMVPTLLKLKARSVEEFGPFVQHPGEEFSVVLAGTAGIYTEYYEPVILEENHCIYIDSTMAHAYINCGEGETIVLTVCSSHELDLKNELQQILHPTLKQVEGPKAKRKRAARKSRKHRQSQTTS